MKSKTKKQKGLTQTRRRAMRLTQKYKSQIIGFVRNYISRDKNFR